MMNRVYSVIFLLIINITISLGQKLQIGDTFPEILLNDIDKKPDGKNKLNILYFWSHSCSSCLESIPKLNKLNETFEKDVNLVMINRESKDSTQRFFDQRHWLTQPNLSMINNDTIIQNHFEFYGLPFVVWLDKRMVIRGFDTGRGLNDEIIKKFIETDELDIEKQLQRISVSSLFDEKHKDMLLSFSYLAKSKEHINIRNDSALIHDILVNKYTLEMLYRHAYEEEGKIKLAQSWQFKIDSTLSQEQLYDYALMMGDKKTENKFDRMKNDLDGFFGVRSYLDTIPMKGLVLVAKDTSNRLATKGAEPQNTFRMNSRTSTRPVLDNEDRVLKNQPYERFSRAIQNLVERHLHVPFLDEVKIEGNVDVSFDYLVFDFFTFQLLQEALAEYGLMLKCRLLQVPVLVIELDEN